MQHAHRQRSLITEPPDDTRQAVDLGPLVLAPFFHGRRARTETSRHDHPDYDLPRLLGALLVRQLEISIGALAVPLIGSER
jgi:hypothetical protein